MCVGLRLSLVTFVYCVFSSASIGFAQPKDPFSVTLIAGTDSKTYEMASVALNKAIKIEHCMDIRLVKSPQVHRLIGIYDVGLAAKFDGKKTIEPVVNHIGAQQNVAFYQRDESDLTIEELIKICNFLPWNTSELPPDVDFYTDFDDPAECSTFASTISDEPATLRFFEMSEVDLGTIRYFASTQLKEKGTNQIASLLVVGLKDKLISNEELSRLPWPNPVKARAIESDVFLLFRHTNDDKATQFLSNWIDNQK